MATDQLGDISMGMKRLRLQAGQAVPPYRQITDDLRRLIVAGTWAVGTHLPSRRDLAAQYDVTPNTINRAIAELMNEGLLGANDRQGTFVAAPIEPSPQVGKAPAALKALRRGSRVGVVVALDDSPGVPPDVWTSAVFEQFERALSAGGALAVFKRG